MKKELPETKLIPVVSSIANWAKTSLIKIPQHYTITPHITQNSPIPQQKALLVFNAPSKDFYLPSFVITDDLELRAYLPCGKYLPPLSRDFDTLPNQVGFAITNIFRSALTHIEASFMTYTETGDIDLLNEMVLRRFKVPKLLPSTARTVAAKDKCSYAGSAKAMRNISLHAIITQLSGLKFATFSPNILSEEFEKVQLDEHTLYTHCFHTAYIHLTLQSMELGHYRITNPTLSHNKQATRKDLEWELVHRLDKVTPQSLLEIYTHAIMLTLTEIVKEECGNLLEETEMWFAESPDEIKKVHMGVDYFNSVWRF